MSNSAAIYPLPGQNLDFQLTVDMSGFESQIDSRVAEHIKKLRAALRNGAPQSQMQSILDEAFAPGSFHEAIGGIRVYAPEAVRLTLLKQQGTNAKPAIHRFIGDQFSKAQENCDEFFGSDFVRNWVIAASLKQDFQLKTWDEVDALMADPEWLHRHRTSDWWRVAWSYKVNEIVESAYGPGSCTKELFIATWNNFAPKDVMSCFESIPPSEIAYYRCMDIG